MTTDRKAPMPSLWIFIVGDLILLGIAALAIFWTPAPLAAWQVLTAAGCAIVGAWFSFIPFLKRYEAEVKLSETDRLADTMAQLQNLEEIGQQIRAATAQWQGVQESASKTTTVAKEIAERMSGEAKAFQEFLKKNNEAEKHNLRLEIDKLRRSESEWLQMMVRLLDHVFALHSAGMRSGQRGLIEQLTQFQNACRDVARRAGLVAFMARLDEPFNAEAHQLADPKAVAVEGDVVEGTVMPGFTFQGQLVRKAVVVLKSASTPEEVAPAALEEAPAESEAEEPSTEALAPEPVDEAPVVEESAASEPVAETESVAEVASEPVTEAVETEPTVTEPEAAPTDEELVVEELKAETVTEAPAPEAVEEESELEASRGKRATRPQEPELF